MSDIHERHLSCSMSYQLMAGISSLVWTLTYTSQLRFELLSVAISQVGLWIPFLSPLMIIFRL